MKGVLLVRNSPEAIRLQYELIYASEQVERYRISGANRSIVVQNNKPLLMNSNSKKQLQWQLIEGKLSNARFWALMILALEEEITRKK